MLKPFVMVVEALNADMKLKRGEAVGPRRGKCEAYARYSNASFVEGGFRRLMRM